MMGTRSAASATASAVNQPKSSSCNLRQGLRERARVTSQGEGQGDGGRAGSGGRAERSRPASARPHRGERIVRVCVEPRGEKDGLWLERAHLGSREGWDEGWGEGEEDVLRLKGAHSRQELVLPGRPERVAAAATLQRARDDLTCVRLGLGLGLGLGSLERRRRAPRASDHAAHRSLARLRERAGPGWGWGSGSGQGQGQGQGQG